MGATNCAACPASCDNKACGGGPTDVLNEYEPQPTKEVNNEAMEIAAPAAVGALDQDGSSDSYFARELQELRNLPAKGPDGHRPAYFFKTGASYKGQWKGNCRHGIGEQEWPDGAKFIGTWNENYAEGHGLFVHADGDGFIGQWKRSAAEGLGTYYHKKGLTTYRGEWLQDMQHGIGVEEWEGGSKYHGQFSWGKKQGHGIYYWPDGSIYAGQWESNAINGLGHYRGKDGREFKGTWKEAVIHGCGCYTWHDGRSYIGQYVEDQKHGFGTFKWMDGRRFEGYWKEGKQHGQGITYASDNTIIKEGRWNMGQMVDDDLEKLPKP